MHLFFTLIYLMFTDRAEKFDEKLARKLREITPLLTDEIREKTSSERIRFYILLI